MPADKISKKHQCVADGVFYAELDEVDVAEEISASSSSTASWLRSATPESACASPP